MLAEHLGAVLTKQELNATFKEMLSYSADKDKLLRYSADKVDFEGFSKWWEPGHKWAQRISQIA